MGSTHSCYRKYKATAVSDMTTSSPTCSFTASTTASKASAFTAVPLPVAIIIHFAASNTTTAAPTADDATTAGAIHNTTIDILLSTTDCLCLAIYLATALIGLTECSNESMYTPSFTSLYRIVRVLSKYKCNPAKLYVFCLCTI
jgi:hypothetical protein